MRGTVTKKRNRWYICYYVGKDENGKWKQKWEGSWETKREAEKVLRSRVEDLENSFERKVDKSTLASFLEYWQEVYCKPRLAANTIRGYRVNIDKHIVPYIGQIQLNRLQPNDIQKLYSDLEAAGLSGTSVRYVHNNLHKALGFAVKSQLIPRNPADMVEPPRVNRKEARTLTPAEVALLLRACNGQEIELPVLMAVTLGLRRGEALGLQWSDVDMEQRTITVRHSASFTKEGFVLSTTKTKNSRRTLLMPEMVKIAFERNALRQRAAADLIGAEFNPHNLVCCREDGTPFSSNVLQHRFKAVLRENDLPDICFHELRHTNATLMLRNSVPAKIVSSMLGHSSIGITMDTYSHVMTEMQEGAVDVMNEMLKSLC